MTLFHKAYEKRTDLLILARKIIVENKAIYKYDNKELNISTIERINKKLPVKENKTLVKKGKSKLKSYSSKKK